MTSPGSWSEGEDWLVKGQSRREILDVKAHLPAEVLADQTLHFSHKDKSSELGRRLHTTLRKQQLTEKREIR